MRTKTYISEIRQKEDQIQQQESEVEDRLLRPWYCPSRWRDRKGGKQELKKKQAVGKDDMLRRDSLNDSKATTQEREREEMLAPPVPALVGAFEQVARTTAQIKQLVEELRRGGQKPDGYAVVARIVRAAALESHQTLVEAVVGRALDDFLAANRDGSASKEPSYKVLSCVFWSLCYAPAEALVRSYLLFQFGLPLGQDTFDQAYIQFRAIDSAFQQLDRSGTASAGGNHNYRRDQQSPNALDVLRSTELFQALNDYCLAVDPQLADKRAACEHQRQLQHAAVNEQATARYSARSPTDTKHPQEQANYPPQSTSPNSAPTGGPTGMLKAIKNRTSPRSPADLFFDEDDVSTAAAVALCRAQNGRRQGRTNGNPLYRRAGSAASSRAAAEHPPTPAAVWVAPPESMMQVDMQTLFSADASLRFLAGRAHQYFGAIVYTQQRLRILFHGQDFWHGLQANTAVHTVLEKNPRFLGKLTADVYQQQQLVVKRQQQQLAEQKRREQERAKGKIKHAKLHMYRTRSNSTRQKRASLSTTQEMHPGATPESGAELQSLLHQQSIEERVRSHSIGGSQEKANDKASNLSDHRGHEDCERGASQGSRRARSDGSFSAASAPAGAANVTTTLRSRQQQQQQQDNEQADPSVHGVAPNDISKPATSRVLAAIAKHVHVRKRERGAVSPVHELPSAHGGYPLHVRAPQPTLC